MDAQFFLHKLVIQNFATFRNQSIHFRPGFNAIIGETGSGKSLVLEALQLILGGRADKKIVRRDTDYSLVEATFKCDDIAVKKFLEIEGYPLEGKELVIKRMVLKNGTTKAYINHLHCTVNFLTHFSKKFIDLVGQFENQKLLSESYHLQLLDHFGKHSDLVSTFQSKLKIYRELQQRKKELSETKLHREQRLDYLTYQLSEIEKLSPSSQEEEDLLRKKSVLMGLEKNQKLSSLLGEILDGSEQRLGLREQMRLLISLLTKNKDFFEDLTSSGVEIQEQLDTLINSIERKLSVEIDPDELEGVLERLDLYQRLKKKFGGSVEAILQSQVDFLKERDQLQDLDFGLDKIGKDLENLESELIIQSKELHFSRSKKAEALTKELTRRIRELKMSGASIKLMLEELHEFNDYGMSRAYFIAETNPGEGFHKIKDIASGGELSRILLSVRQILSSCDSISIFLFDEIDTGIGGETANCIGKALKDVSVNGQVIAITHLPQIAQFSDSLIIVNKDSKGDRTESHVKELVGKMIYKEVKAMAQLN